MNDAFRLAAKLADSTTEQIEEQWFDAADRGDLETIKRIAAMPGFDIDIMDRDGDTAYSLAKEEGRTKVVDFLDKRGATRDIALLAKQSGRHLRL